MERVVCAPLDAVEKENKKTPKTPVNTPSTATKVPAWHCGIAALQSTNVLFCCSYTGLNGHYSAIVVGTLTDGQIHGYHGYYHVSCTTFLIHGNAAAVVCSYLILVPSQKPFVRRYLCQICLVPIPYTSCTCSHLTSGGTKGLKAKH